MTQNAPWLKGNKSVLDHNLKLYRDPQALLRNKLIPYLCFHYMISSPCTEGLQNNAFLMKTCLPIKLLENFKTNTIHSLCSYSLNLVQHVHKVFQALKNTSIKLSPVTFFLEFPKQYSVEHLCVPESQQMSCVIGVLQPNNFKNRYVSERSNSFPYHRESHSL